MTSQNKKNDVVVLMFTVSSVTGEVGNIILSSEQDFLL